MSAPDFIPHRVAVAAAYAHLVSKSPHDWAALIPRAWAALARDSVDRAAGIRLLLDVRETDDPEPYEHAAEMCADISQGNFTVSRTNCDHPVWFPHENVAFRIVHDVFGHYAASGGVTFRSDWERGVGDELCPPTVAGFDWEGEVAACNRHALLLPFTNARRALFTECLGQTAYALVHGEFAPQAIGFIGPYLAPTDPTDEIGKAYYAFIHPTRGT